MAESEMTGPELGVICPNPGCGQQVSPYVTECPYCGTRIRKRAPELKREGDHLTLREPKGKAKGKDRGKAKVKRERRRPRFRRSGADLRVVESGVLSERLGARPVATIAAVAVPVIAYLAQIALGETIYDFGAIIGPVGSEIWRYLAAPFAYDDVGYLFVCLLAMVIFLPAVERRIGAVPAVLLVIACGALGALAAEGIGDVIGLGLPLIAGGNGIGLGILAAYVVLLEPERRRDPSESFDPIAVAVAAAVLLLLPLVEDFADPVAGIVGLLVGGACGFAALTALRRSSR